MTASPHSRRLEGQNADTFRKNFEGCDWVRVPKVRSGNALGDIALGNA